MFRKINFSKHEKILYNDSVAYGDFKTLIESLEYDISLEKNKNYNDMPIVEVIKNITDFTSSIWQVHPFRDENEPLGQQKTYLQKYLQNKGFTDFGKSFF